jgi:hypothetical protein
VEIDVRAVKNQYVVASQMILMMMLKCALVSSKRDWHSIWISVSFAGEFRWTDYESAV